jgi:hypothetical protein
MRSFAIGSTIDRKTTEVMEKRRQYYFHWNFKRLDDALFGGSMKTPDYLLPLD